MGELGSRPQLILDSLSKWIRNPIFGRYDVDSNSHSLIIGILEQTGIVGLSIVGSLFYSVTKYMLQEMKKSDCLFIYLRFLLFIFCCWHSLIRLVMFLR